MLHGAIFLSYLQKNWFDTTYHKHFILKKTAQRKSISHSTLFDLAFLRARGRIREKLLSDAISA